MLDRLLTLRVDFRDEQAAADVTPEMASRYLTAKGWTLHEQTIAYDVWRKDGRETDTPRQQRFIDYGRRMVGAVNDLAEIEGRSPLAVWWEMTHG